jgi:hypothetical protein
MPKTQTTRKKTGPVATWVVAVAAVAAVLLAAGLYGARAGWFAGDDDDDFVPPKLGQAPPPRSVLTHDDAVARAAWGGEAGAPVVGVGTAVTAEAPPQATLAVEGGRANVAIRVPAAKPGGKPYTGYSLELRSGDRRLWGSFVPVGARGSADAIGLSLNADLIHSIGDDKEPITVVVGGSALRKGDSLGIVRLTLPTAP